MRLQKNVILSRQTIENHLIRSFEDGMEVDWQSFVPKEYESLIETAVQNAEGGLKSIKEQLPNEVSYFMIQCLFTNKKVETYKGDRDLCIMFSFMAR